MKHSWVSHLPVDAYQQACAVTNTLANAGEKYVFTGITFDPADRMMGAAFIREKVIREWAHDLGMHSEIEWQGLEGELAEVNNELDALREENDKLRKIAEAVALAGELS